MPEIIQPPRKAVRPVWPYGQTFTCKRCGAGFVPKVGEKPDGFEAAPKPGTGLQTGGQILGATFALLAVYGCPCCGEPCELRGEIRQGETDARTLPKALDV